MFFISFEKWYDWDLTTPIGHFHMRPHIPEMYDSCAEEEQDSSVDIDPGALHFSVDWEWIGFNARLFLYINPAPEWPEE